MQKRSIYAGGSYSPLRIRIETYMLRCWKRVPSNCAALWNTECWFIFVSKNHPIHCFIAIFGHNCLIRIPQAWFSALALEKQLNTHAHIKDFVALSGVPNCTAIKTHDLVTLFKAQMQQVLSAADLRCQSLSGGITTYTLQIQSKLLIA